MSRLQAQRSSVSNSSMAFGGASTASRTNSSRAFSPRSTACRREQHDRRPAQVVQPDVPARRLRDAARRRVVARVDAEASVAADLTDPLDASPELLPIQVAGAGLSVEFSQEFLDRRGLQGVFHVTTVDVETALCAVLT